MTYYLADSESGTMRELTFDECELLALDGTLRGVQQCETLMDVVVPGTVVVVVKSIGHEHRVTSITFTPAAADPGYVGPPAEVIRCEGGEPPLDPSQPWCPPFWDAVQGYLDNEGGIEWTS